MQTIGIIARRHEAAILESFDAVTQALIKQKKTVVLDQDSAKTLGQSQFERLPATELAEKSDLVIIIGGDGSFLHAAHDVVQYDTPMVGINRGKLGFLTDIQPDNIEQDLTDIFNGHYQIEKRFLLESHFENQMHRALNEVSLVSDNKNNMIAFDIFVDNDFLLREKSDGLIIATPTGSTAYALSGGGPILHPELDSLVLVPMFSHTLSSRPVVIDANHTITIKLIENLGVLNLDGNTQHFIKPKHAFTIQKHPKLLNLVHPKSYDYFDTIRTKLHWGTRA